MSDIFIKSNGSVKLNISSFQARFGGLFFFTFLQNVFVEKMKAKAAELGMPCQAVARKALKAAFA